MKKTITILTITGLLLIIVATSVFAYSTASGCVVDGSNGQPWTHGGSAQIWNNGSPTGPAFELDGNGCFDAQLYSGGTHGAVQAIVTLDPGPDGTPNPITCEIPADNTTGNFDCGTQPTDTGPNAVTWSNVSAESSSGFPLEAAAFGILALTLMAGGIAVLRQQRQTY